MHCNKTLPAALDPESGAAGGPLRPSTLLIRTN
jgi:hypothetical protein